MDVPGVNLGFTLTRAHDEITCAGSLSLRVAESRAELEAQGQGQDVAVIQTGLNAGLKQVGSDGEETSLPMKGELEWRRPGVGAWDRWIH